MSFQNITEQSLDYRNCKPVICQNDAALEYNVIQEFKTKTEAYRDITKQFLTLLTFYTF